MVKKQREFMNAGHKKLRNYSIIMMILSLFMLSGCSDDSQIEADQVSSVAVSEQAESSKSSESESKETEKQEKAEAEEEAKAEAESAQKAKEEAESKAQAEADAKVEAERLAIQTAAPPVPDGNTYVEVNGNVPLFTNEDLSSTEAWEDYGALDHLGRVTVANAVLGVELMPAAERGNISDVTPTGWNQAKYDVVSGGWLYNRSHLIGFQLTGEDANNRNLMTGTRWFNTEGMLPFENFVANYVETTENHVRYRVTPYFEGDNMLASGLYMEGMSIEDNGNDLMFHIYVPNIQPQVHIDYATGSSWVDEPEVEVVEEVPAETVVEEVPVLETAPGGDVSSVDTNGNGQVTIKEAKEAGFSMPIYSDHWLYPYMDDRDGDGMVGE
ncbi:DNA/RNA non-specific endonuclease [Jeotgalibaca sp. A122]|uniref:DNA/RNA non-specific endonuclease n=1 Tax=Jeotgalibaca sp. A122 TaxID=3457322 RepID=UPI003FD191AB